VIDNDSISRLEAPAAGTGFHNLAAGFMTSDDALIAFRTFAQMFVIDAADIRAADGGGLYAD